MFVFYVILTISYLRTQTIEMSSLPTDSSRPLFKQIEIFSIQSTLSKTDTFGTGTSCPSYRESNGGSKERQGPTLGVRLIEVSVKRESTVDMTKAKTATPVA